MAVNYDAGSAGGRPGNIHGAGQRAPPVQHADRGSIHRQTVHEVGGPVQGIQDPQEIGGGPVAVSAGVVLLAQDTVFREPARYLVNQIRLGLFVGGGDRVLLRLVLVLNAERPPEVAGQQVPRTAGKFHRGGFDLGGSRLYALVRCHTAADCTPLPHGGRGVGTGTGQDWWISVECRIGCYNPVQHSRRPGNGSATER